MAAEAHVPLARVRNFRVREGFTSGREANIRACRTKSAYLLLADLSVFPPQKFFWRGGGARRGEAGNKTPLL